MVIFFLLIFGWLHESNAKKEEEKKKHLHLISLLSASLFHILLCGCC